MRRSQTRKEQQDLIVPMWNSVKQDKEALAKFQQYFKSAKKLFQRDYGKKRSFSNSTIMSFYQPPSTTSASSSSSSTPITPHGSCTAAAAAEDGDVGGPIVMGCNPEDFDFDVAALQNEVTFYWFRHHLKEGHTEAIEKKISEDGVLEKMFQCTTLQSELAIAAHEEYHSLRRSESTQKSKKPKYQEAADDVKECVESILSTVEKILSSRREMLDARREIQHMGMNVDETSAAMQDPVIQQLPVSVAQLNSFLGKYANQLNVRIDDMRSYIRKNICQKGQKFGLTPNFQLACECHLSWEDAVARLHELNYLDKPPVSFERMTRVAQMLEVEWYSDAQKMQTRSQRHQLCSAMVACVPCATQWEEVHHTFLSCVSVSAAVNEKQQ